MNISTEFADEIINRLANNSAVDKEASLPFDAASLTETFNAQLKRADDKKSIQPQMFIDDAQIFTDAENVLFVKIFNDAAGLFGIGTAGGNFKILSLCRIVDATRTNSDLLFVAFVKTFLPNVPIDEFTALLSANKIVTAAGIIFVQHKLDGLDMLNVFVEPEEVIT